MHFLDFKYAEVVAKGSHKMRSLLLFSIIFTVPISFCAESSGPDVACWIEHVDCTFKSGTDEFKIRIINPTVFHLPASKAEKPDVALFIDGQQIGDANLICGWDRKVCTNDEGYSVYDLVYRAPASKFDQSNMHPKTGYVGLGKKSQNKIIADKPYGNISKEALAVCRYPQWKDGTAPESQSVWDLYCGVVAVDPTEGQLNDTVTVTVANPDAYIQWAKSQESKHESRSKQRDLSHLVLFLNDRPIPATDSIVSPTYLETYASTDLDAEFVAQWCKIQFRLTRDSQSNVAWGNLLNRPTLIRPVSLSVGFEDLNPMSTNVMDDPKFKPAPLKPFLLRVLPADLWSAVGAALIIFTSIAFGYLAFYTDLIRDAASTLRPDGQRPYSLARTQMAFWFFLVFSTYYFIWIITGDKDTIPMSILGLIGISAATAVGSALVDSSIQKGAIAKTTPIRQDVLQNQYNTLNEEIITTTAEIKSLKAAQPAGSSQILQLETVLNEKKKQLGEKGDILQYMNRSSLNKFLEDLLMEDNAISFHRFQILVWTLVLGTIFCKEVYIKLAMPEFSSTLLGLMGVSAATYVSLKNRLAGSPAQP